MYIVEPLESAHWCYVKFKHKQAKGGWPAQALAWHTTNQILHSKRKLKEALNVPEIRKKSLIHNNISQWSINLKVIRGFSWYGKIVKVGIWRHHSQLQLPLGQPQNWVFTILPLILDFFQRPCLICCYLQAFRNPFVRDFSFNKLSE